MKDKSIGYDEDAPQQNIPQVTFPVTLLEYYGIYLFHKPVTLDSCAAAIKYIFEANLNSARSYDKIQLVINSPGGDLESAFALTDVMQGSRIPVYTTGLGLIASAGLVIFMAGKKGHRVVTPNTMILSHQWSWASEGKEHELLASVKAFELIQEKMLAHYRKFTHLSEKKIQQYLLPPNDVWISAEDAVKLNIADKIVSPQIQFREVMPNE